MDTVIIDDWIDPIRSIVRHGHFDSGDIEATALQFQSLLTGAGADLQDFCTGWKKGQNPVDLCEPQCIKVPKREHGSGIVPE